VADVLSVIGSAPLPDVTDSFIHGIETKILKM
jgi:hypothetical protein